MKPRRLELVAAAVLVVAAIGVVACEPKNASESQTPAATIEVIPTPSEPRSAAVELKSGSTTWDYKRSDGYSYSLTFTMWEPIPADASGPIGHPGDSGLTLDSVVDYDPSKDVAIPFQIQAKNTTSDFSLDELGYSVEFFAVGGSDPTFRIDGNHPVFMDYVRSDGAMTEQWAVQTNGGSVLVTPYKEAEAAGHYWASVAPQATGSMNAFIILNDYFTPATPDGPKGLLDKLAVGPGIGSVFNWEATDKSNALGLTFSGKVVAGGK